MKNFKHTIHILIVIIILFIVFGLATHGQTQYINPFNPFWGITPYFFTYPLVPFAFYPPLIPAPTYYPYVSAPMAAQSLPPRVGAATIIITNPTAGTVAVTVVNPTVASIPTVTTAAPAPAPLLSVLAPLYVSFLYEGPLTTANPLLFAILQTIFLP